MVRIGCLLLPFPSPATFREKKLRVRFQAIYEAHINPKP
jgi:hypothetical protein